MKKKYRLSFNLSFIFVFLSDLFFKVVIVNKMISGKMLFRFDALSISAYMNTGGFLEIAKDNFLFFSILSLISILLVLFLYLFYPKMNRAFSISAGFILGGLMSNFLNRLLQGGVLDYLRLPVFFTDSFVLVNFADVFIVLGILISSFFALGMKSSEDISKKENLSY